mgnify:CR=1 FL=1
MARFTLPRDLYHGKGSLEALKNLQGKKAMICVGGGSMKRFGFLDRAVGYLEEAGFELRLPSCSACLAMNPDKVPAGKLSISTSNRNFVGRQGPGARTILASPLVVAASAITGVVTDPRSL